MMNMGTGVEVRKLSRNAGSDERGCERGSERQPNFEALVSLFRRGQETGG